MVKFYRVFGIIAINIGPKSAHNGLVLKVSDYRQTINI